MKTTTYTTPEERQEKILAVLERIDRKLDIIVKKQPPVDLDLMTNQQLLQELGISKRTAAEWRKDGTLLYTKIKGRIYYRKSDVKAMLQEGFQRE